MTLKAQHIKRYKEIAHLFVKYGRGDLLRGSGFETDIVDAPAVLSPKAEEFAADLEKLGPTFIKLGQLLSTRADFLPPPYRQSLTRLQDKVEPFPYEEVEAIVPAELGVRISKAFTTFEPEPMAAASLGQVHRATLRDGRAVAVKVQRPEIRRRMVDDLEALDEIARFLDGHTELGRRYEFGTIIEEFRQSLLAELDYRLEANNLRVMQEKLAQFENIIVPRPIDSFTTSRVLTMEYISGRKITALNPVVRLDIPGSQLADELFKAYLHMILVDGFFHADPHPGNVFLTNDHRIALLDLGMVARIGSRLQEQLLQLILAISEGRGDDAAEAAIKMGSPKSDFDEAAFRRKISDFVGRQQDASLDRIQVGRVVLEVQQLSVECGIRVPRELTMLGKTLMNLDLVGRTLDEQFDPNAAIRREASNILRLRLLKSMAPGNLLGGLLEVKDMIERLPLRINRLLDALTNNELEIKVDTIDEKVLMDGMQKVANRITLGLILAALIVGAAMLMRVETSFRLFGYPGLAILCFLAATAGAIVLMFSILLHDRSRKK
jgi:ubiquinone biosynthesis protein